jgi:MFS transporter, ACS family, solute carrier family 17 (sodium-dependent inorganic phosphate cotransporter), other
VREQHFQHCLVSFEILFIILNKHKNILKITALLATWVPLKERGKLGSFVFGGGQVGTIFGTAVSGVLIDYFDTWESVFYFFGILAIIWFIIFVLICYKDPESHPFITQKEKDYLQREMGSLARSKTLAPTPWAAILTNVPMMALVCAQIGHDFGFFIMATDLPKVCIIKCCTS